MKLKNGDTYWYIEGDGAWWKIWRNDEIDKLYMKAGNVYESFAEAKNRRLNEAK